MKIENCKLRIVFLHGKNSFLRKKRKKELVAELARELKVSRVAKFEVSLASAISQNEQIRKLRQKLTGQSLFGEKELIALDILAEEKKRSPARTEKAKKNKPQKAGQNLEKMLVDRISHLNDNVSLIIESNRKWPKSGPLFKALSRIPESKIELFEMPKKSQKRWENTQPLFDFIRDFERREGIRIDGTVARKLVEASAGDFWYILTALEQTVLYQKARKEKASAEELTQLWDMEEEKSIFNFFDAVGEGNKARALSLLYEINSQSRLKSGGALYRTAQGGEVEIALGFSSMAARQIKQMIAVKEGVSQKEAQSDWGVPYFAYNKLRSQSAYFTLDFLKNASSKIIELQENAKRGLFSPLWLVDFFALYLISHRSTAISRSQSA